MTTKKAKKAPWERSAPRTAHHTSLTPAQKQHAKARAARAGRHYPNLVDNMHEAEEAAGTRKKATRSKSAARPAAHKAPAPRKSAASSASKKTSSRRKSAASPASKKKTSSRRKSAASPASKKKTSTRRKAAASPASKKKTSTRGAKKPTKDKTKDPHGGLTAAGRRMFHERDGANLKPGVRKKTSQMTTEEMRRKGSWATRFYGRKKLPPLQDEQGKPTRFALSAAAWGEPVPKTVRQARNIAARGRKLLEQAGAHG